MSRVLPVEEWPRLAASVPETCWRPLDPATTRIVVIERGDRIVGHHILTLLVHAECLWVDPEDRGKGHVAGRLWAAVQRTVREDYHAGAFVTAAVDDKVRGLLDHVGAIKIPADNYIVPVKGRS